MTDLSVRSQAKTWYIIPNCFHLPSHVSQLALAQRFKHAHSHVFTSRVPSLAQKAVNELVRKIIIINRAIMIFISIFTMVTVILLLNKSPPSSIFMSSPSLSAPTPYICP